MTLPYDTNYYLGGGGGTLRYNLLYCSNAEILLDFFNRSRSLELLIKEISLHTKPLDWNYAIATGQDAFYKLS
jgi:hypothetical protein